MIDSALLCTQASEDMKTAVVALALVMCASVVTAQFGGGPFGGGGGFEDGGNGGYGGGQEGGQRGCPLPLLCMYRPLSMLMSTSAVVAYACLCYH